MQFFFCNAKKKNMCVSFLLKCMELCTANTLYRKFETNILRNETARPRSQFRNSCTVYVSELYIRKICPQTQYSKIGGQIVGIYKPLTDTWMQKLGTRCANSLLGIFVWIFGAVFIATSHEFFLLSIAYFLSDDLEEEAHSSQMKR
jgi:hypothetical protein